MAERIIPFQKPAIRTEQSPISPNTQLLNTHLLKAAKAAYFALLLAVPAGEENAIIRNLGQAIRNSTRTAA